MKVSLVSRCEQEFILRSISVGKRLDGRHIYDYRTISLEFGNELGLCQVALGQTRALIHVSGEVVVPTTYRPSDGILYINVDLSPMASPDFEPGRLTDYGVEMQRLLERCIIDSRALDVESLCIVAGEKVWAIRVDARVLNHDGNIVDCLSIGVIAALVHFRRPDVTVSGQDVTIHTMKEKQPVPLSIHHWPISVTFAFFDKGNDLIVDPTEREERVMDGKTVLAMNIYKEICTLHVGGTISLHKDQILQCTQIAAAKVSEFVDLIKASLKADAEKRSRGDYSGFISTIQKNFITTSEQEVVEMDVSETKTSANKLIRESARVAIEGFTKEMTDIPVKVKGPGTAQIGEGGQSTWTISDDDDDDEDDNVIILPAVQNTQKTSATVETVELSGDSEEEVITLTGPEITEPDQHRNWYSDSW